MSQGEILLVEGIFSNYNEIIPNNGENRFFDVEEVEVFKIEIL